MRATRFVYIVEQQLIAVVATNEESKGKTYLDITDAEFIPNLDEISRKIACLSEKEQIDLPLENLQDKDTLNIKVPLYGLTRFIDLFTPRQLLALLTFTAEVHHAYTAMIEAGIAFEQAAAITTYLGLMVDRLADYNSTLCSWHNTEEKIGHTFARQALPMIWDFVEINPFGNGSGNSMDSLNRSLEGIEKRVVNVTNPPKVSRTSATNLPFEDASMDTVITDPPYYIMSPTLI